MRFRTSCCGARPGPSTPGHADAAAPPGLPECRQTPGRVRWVAPARCRARCPTTAGAGPRRAVAATPTSPAADPRSSWSGSSWPPPVNLEWAAVITSTGNNVRDPSSSTILRGGNHRSHCAASPGAHTSRSAGSTGRCSPQLVHVVTEPADRSRPARSATTVAGMSGVSANNCRTLASNGVNDVGLCLRSYSGGPSDTSAFATVFREIPNLAAILAFGTPSAASLRD